MECKNPKTAGSSKIAIIAIITALIIGGIYYFKSQSTDEESTTPPSVEVEGPSGLEGFIKKGSLWGRDTAGLDKTEYEKRLLEWKTANNYTDANMINLPGGELLYMYNGSGKEITAKDVLLSMALGSDSYVILISFGQDGNEQWVMTPGMTQTTIPDAKNPSKSWNITNYATDPALHKIQAGQGYLLYLYTPKEKDETTKVTGSKSIKAFGAMVQRNQDKNSLAETSTALTAGWNMTAFNNVIYKAAHFDNFKITNVWEVASDGDHVGPYSIEEVTTKNTANMIWFQYGPATTVPTPPVEPVYTKATLVIDPDTVKMDSEIIITVVDPDADLTADKDKITIHVSSNADEPGIDIQATETEVTSGKFAAKINVSAAESTLTNLKAGEGREAVKAEYVDTTMPDASIYTATDTATVFVEVIEPTKVEVKFFDYIKPELIYAAQFEKTKKENIVIVVEDSAANKDSEKIDEVEVTLKVNGKTKLIKLNEFSFGSEEPRKDKNTGKFAGLIYFHTGGVEGDDEYEFSEVAVGETVTAKYSDTVSSNYVTIVGEKEVEAPKQVEVMFFDTKKGGQLFYEDEEGSNLFKRNNKQYIGIMVKDPAANTKPDVVEEVNVELVLRSGGKMEVISLKEYSLEDPIGPNNNTGVFAAKIFFDGREGLEENQHNFLVTTTDIVSAKYLDTTTSSNGVLVNVEEKVKGAEATIQFLIVGSDKVVGEKLMIPGSKIKVKIVDGDVLPINTKNVILTLIGADKIKVIKAVRIINELSLREAKELVESVPIIIKEGVTEAEAAEIKNKLEVAGATVEIVDAGDIGVQQIQYQLGFDGEFHDYKASQVREGVFESGDITVLAEQHDTGEKLKASYYDESYNETISVETILDKKVETKGACKEDLAMFGPACNFRAFWFVDYYEPGTEDSKIEVVICDVDQRKGSLDGALFEGVIDDNIEIELVENLYEEENKKNFTLEYVGKSDNDKYITDSGLDVYFPFCYSKLIGLSADYVSGDNKDVMEIKEITGFEMFGFDMIYIDESLPVQGNEVSIETSGASIVDFPFFPEVLKYYDDQVTEQSIHFYWNKSRNEISLTQNSEHAIITDYIN